MRGVIKKRKYFQFFFKKKYIFIIFIKLILFCFKFKNFFFFINTIFLYNAQSLSVTVKDFFFSKKKLKKTNRDSFAVFFKKFLKKRRLFFGKTIRNRLQIQKLSDNHGHDYFIKWVRIYRNYINIFSSGHKL